MNTEKKKRVPKNEKLFFFYYTAGNAFFPSFIHSYLQVTFLQFIKNNCFTRGEIYSSTTDDTAEKVGTRNSI